MQNSETHRACETRLSLEGGKARCCDCVPHENCDFNKPELKEKPMNKVFGYVEEECINGTCDCHEPKEKPSWEKKFDEKFGVVPDPLEGEPNRGWTDEGMLSEPLKDFIRKLLAEQQTQFEKSLDTLYQKHAKELIEAYNTGYVAHQKLDRDI